MLRYSNIVCTVLLLLAGILRMSWMFSDHEVTGAAKIKDTHPDGQGGTVMEEEVVVSSESRFNFFFLITTVYFIIFAIMFGLTEMPEGNKFRNKITIYFNFLDFQLGKGFFLIYLALMTGEIGGAGNVILAIIVFGVGACNIIIGWSQEKKDSVTYPWDDLQSE